MERNGILGNMEQLLKASLQSLTSTKCISLSVELDKFCIARVLGLVLGLGLGQG